MENIPPEYECLVCLDLLIEPVTTICGHTFCKQCLIKTLNEIHCCPTCRKQLFISKENLVKNFTLETIIKSEFPQKYEEGVKKAALKENNNENETKASYTNVLSVLFENCFVVPEIAKEIKVSNSGTVLDIANNFSISASTSNDRVICIIPKINVTEGTVCSLCEIISFYKGDEESTRFLKVKGIKRVKLVSFQRDRGMFLSEVVDFADDPVASDEAKKEILDKLNEIIRKHQEIQKAIPFSVNTVIEKKYGKPPSSILATYNSWKVEALSLYFLTIIKGRVKAEYFSQGNALARINYILGEYERVIGHKTNPSMPYMFFDIPGNNLLGENTKQVMVMLIIFAVIVVLMNFNLIRIR